MAMIFEKPIIHNGQGGNVVLIYGQYIIGNITKEDADISIEKIKNNSFAESEFNSVVFINDVVGYEFIPGSDSLIKFEIFNNNATSSKIINFQNVNVAKEAELSIQNQFKQLGFKREEIQLTPLQAAVSPAVTTLGVAGGGAILTWFAYNVDNYESTRRRIKWYVKLFNELSRTVGYVPFLVLTAVLTILCLFWLVRRMVNPPFKISAVK